MPKIKSDIIKWARENAGLTIEEAAYKLQITDGAATSAAEKLDIYEEGKKEPSRALLLRMSKQYRQPLLTFYLDQPPVIGDRGEDFRTIPEQFFEEAENANIDVLIRDIKARQSTIRETLIDEDEEIHLDFIGKHTINSGVKTIVQTIREALNLKLENYRSQPNYKESFKILRQRTESAGIFILLKGNLGSYHSNISVSAFRGFALSDDVAPFIVINDNDIESAWSFTLLHEMTHLILGQTGISGTSAEKQIEKFCNNVASEYFLPATEFDSFKVTNLEFDMLTTKISDYAFSKKVSSSHIAYRLYLRGDISKQIWESLSDFYRKKWLEGRKQIKEDNKIKDGAPSYYVVKRYKLGTLVELVKRLTYSGALTTTKAGMLLDTKPLKVHRLFQTG